MDQTNVIVTKHDSEAPARLHGVMTQAANQEAIRVAFDDNTLRKAANTSARSTLLGR